MYCLGRNEEAHCNETQISLNLVARACRRSGFWRVHRDYYCRRRKLPRAKNFCFLSVLFLLFLEQPIGLDGLTITGNALTDIHTLFRTEHSSIRRQKQKRMANAAEDFSQFGISKEEKDKLVGEVIRYMLFKIPSKFWVPYQERGTHSTRYEELSSA
ncbi:hypothetical protein E2542_SST01291 [Spatholobus suberectus]|nr:hypothetical protein E2542_SST01291 [Spatholobus suberectus]